MVSIGIAVILTRASLPWPEIFGGDPMTQDAWLAIAHHLAIFSLLGVMAVEWGIVRPGIERGDIGRLVRVDRMYGMVAGAVLLIGLARLQWGAKPWSFYTDNPFFWIKLASFAAVGILSIGPTRRYIQWAGADAAPDDGDVNVARRGLRLQFAVFPLIPICAALMARGIGH
jgi:putative membrane protein